MPLKFKLSKVKKGLQELKATARASKKYFDTELI